MFISVFYHVNLELLVYLYFQGIMILLLFVLLLNIYFLFFLLFCKTREIPISGLRAKS